MSIEVAGEDVCGGWGEFLLLLKGVVEILGACLIWTSYTPVMWIGCIHLC
jgi:hypothetical protein